MGKTRKASLDVAGQFKIEKNVPLPGKGRGANNRYPWKTMEIGDSIYVPCGPGENVKAVMNRMSGSLVWARPKKFVRRTEGNGVRAWRVE